MITQKYPTPMVRVNLPALRLRAAYWSAMEDALLAEVARIATARQAAQAKQVAL